MVRPPGPPSVITYTSPKLLKFQMTFRLVIDAITGRIAGSDTLKNRRQAPAPSMAAASRCSSGICWSAASSVIVVCGMPTQMPTTMTAGRAVSKVPSQLVVTGVPVIDSTALSGPLVA